MKQKTSNLFLIRPFRFFCNPETAVNNYFQSNSIDEEIANVSQKALKEFDEFFNLLKKNNLTIFLFNDTNRPVTPDALFPNNWISTYQNGTIFLHSMFAENRRLERRDDIVSFLKENFSVSEVYNKADFQEKNNQFLEGTGSMVLDRENKIVYAALSERTNQILVEDFCKKMNFSCLVFRAFQSPKKIIYHTNVMMSVCKDFAVICLDSILDKNEQKKILNSLNQTKKEVILISIEQMNNFCGNILEVENQNRESILIMSTRAFKAFSKTQKKIINRYCKIVHSSLDTIENFGGGGARCMLAEIFLKKIL